MVLKKDIIMKKTEIIYSDAQMARAQGILDTNGIIKIII